MDGVCRGAGFVDGRGRAYAAFRPQYRLQNDCIGWRGHLTYRHVTPRLLAASAVHSQHRAIHIFQQQSLDNLLAD